MAPTRDAHVVAAHTDGLAEMQALRDAIEPTELPVAEQLHDILDAATAFLAAAMPMRALLLTDHLLAADFRDVTRRTGIGPQGLVVEVASWVDHMRRRGHISPDVEPGPAALMICGAADFLACLSLTVPDDLAAAACGRRDHLVGLLTAALQHASVDLLVEARSRG